MGEFSLRGRWDMTAEPEAVWKVVSDPGCWQQWWGTIRRIEPLPDAASHRDSPDDPDNADEAGEAGEAAWVRPGSAVRLVFDIPVPFRDLTVDVELTDLRPPRLLAVASRGGALRGSGEMEVGSDGELTTVEYRFGVRTTRPWLGFIDAVLRAAVRADGGRSLAAAGERLAGLAGGDLVDSHT